MATSQTPEVLWAQRSSSSDAEKNYIYLTISVPDVPKSKLKLDIQPTSVDFAGYSDSKKTQYAVKIELFAEIDPAESKINHTAANVQIILHKKELKEEFWPRLLKDRAKVHYLRTDFDKWVDEDEQDEAPEDDYMNQFGGMGGAGGDEGFGGIDFSKLGGAAGMPGMEGLGGAGGDEDDDDEEGDDDMPELEDEAEAGAEGTGKGKGKIEEIA